MSCFQKSSGVSHKVDGWKICDGTSDCCALNDLCLPNHMCFSLANATNNVDYYPAGCSDEAFPGDKCPGWCGAEQGSQHAAVWNNGNDTWTCCGRGNIGTIDCNPATGENFKGPWSQPAYDDLIHKAHGLATAALVGIIIAVVVGVGLLAFAVFCCCCSRRARERRSRGKFVPLGSGRDNAGDQVVWNSNMHDGGHELHDGPMGGYAAPPHGPGMHGAPQYTVQGFR